MATSTPIEPAATRTEAQIVRVIHAWRRHGPTGEAFAAGLSDWLRLSQSDNTRAVYSFSVLEFFDWYDLAHRHIPLPDRYERKVAIDYADYLRSRPEGLDEARLARDGRLVLELAAYRAIKRSPGITGDDIREVLDREHGYEVRRRDRDQPGWYDRFLSCLVTRKLADRSPTLYELSTRYKGDDRPPAFTYRPHVHTVARGVERSSTLVTRLSALSSLWRYYIERSGENTGRRPLLSYDIWSPVLEQYTPSAISQHRAARELTSMTLETFKALIASTSRPSPNTLQNLRDRALLLFMFYTAVRAEEVVSLLRSSLTGDPPLVTVVGKGAKIRQFRLPEAVRGHLDAMTAGLLAAADLAKSKHLYDREERLRRLLRDDAPLFPALVRRGCDVGGDDAIGRDALAMMMRRRALASGLGHPDILRTVHPHAIRHLAAKIAVDLGTPITRVQAVMGHEHVSTTGMYAEEHDPRALALFSPPPAAAAAPSPPPPRAVGAPPQIIDVEMEEVRIPELPAPKLPPPQPVSRQIVELGGKTRIAHEEALGITPGEHDVMARLDTLYTSATWGEKGDSTILHKAQEKLPGFDTDEDRLVTVHEGKWSHLLWWYGFSGKLRPQMPVLSPRQAFAPASRFLPAEESIQDALAGLYDRWYASDEPKKGPTAAAALVMWIKEALVTMDQVELDREMRGLRWVAYDAPFSKTESFREHREDRVVTWFEARGGVWTLTPGEVSERKKRPAKTEDEPKIPAFYSEADPLAAIPEAERADYFDWLAAMTGKAPPSTEKRFLSAPGDLAPTLTRKDLASVVGLFCAYDQTEDDLGGDDPGELKRALKSTSDAISQTVSKLSRGRSRLDYGARVAARKKETRAGSRAGNRVFYMKILGELFGEAAGKDSVLALYTACGKEPLAGESVPGGTYAEFFRVEGGTVVHTQKFREAFAKATGAHSECVARRVARSLYELQKADARLLDPTREAELETQLASWAAFKVPCPAALEGELKSRLGAAGADPARVRDPFARHQEVGRLASDKELEEELEGRVGAGGVEVFERKGLAEGGGFHYAKNARRWCPSVVHLTFWVHEHRRVRRMLLARG